jgi:hypothetical protein
LFNFSSKKLQHFPKKEKNVKWYKDLPVGHIEDRKPNTQHVLQLTLEFGFHHYPEKSSLEFLGPSDPNDTEKAAFLHPVIRHFYKDTMEEFHFGDSLLGRWDMPHAEGGAIASYHTEFHNWMADIFGIEKISTKEMIDNPNYEKW